MGGIFNNRLLFENKKVNTEILSSLIRFSLGG